MEDKKVSTTLLGHELVLQDVVAKTASTVGWVEERVKDAVKDVPYASLVMAGISLILPVLTNPPKTDRAQQDGFTYVTSQMKYYSSMESLLLPKELDHYLKHDLSERLLQLYQSIIDFQLQSLVRFYRRRTKSYFRDVVDYDDWETQVQQIKEADTDFVSKVETAVSANSLQNLRKLSQEAENSRKVLDGLLKKTQELVDVNRDQLQTLEAIQQKLLEDPRTQACLSDLRVTNTEHDKKRIETTKGGLLSDAYRWVLGCDAFQEWHNSSDGQLLWIRGDPGKGKTMLLCGIIDELSPHTRLKDPCASTSMAYFFCQATDSRINNAPAVLRGLIYMLVDQQPALVPHVQRHYDKDGKAVFEGVNAWTALTEILCNILEDPAMQDTCIIIDALDECIGVKRSEDESTTDMIELLRFIQSAKARPGIKWLVSSRNWTEIEKELDEVREMQTIPLRLELNAESVSAAVTSYVAFKVEQLARENRYTHKTRVEVETFLTENAEGTFLWVALVCQKIAKIPGWAVLSRNLLEEYPPTLKKLYRRMMGKIDECPWPDLCMKILAVVSTVYRPIALHELSSLVELPDQSATDREAQAEIIGECGSFVTLREDKIFFVHQSAKDYLLNEARKHIYPLEVKDVHRSICSRSLKVMTATLRRDIYGLNKPGFHINKVKTPESDPLATAAYSCVYWVDHLRMSLDEGQSLAEEREVECFLHDKYIYWLEALALLRSLSNGMLSMRTLDDLLQVRQRAMIPMAKSILMTSAGAQH